MILITILGACDGPDRGIDIPQEKSSILGCYYNAKTESSIRIELNKILFNDRQIYNRYEYGITGRRNLPTILAWPGTVFRYGDVNGTSLETELYGDGQGPVNFSFVESARLQTLQIVAFPDGAMFNFVRAPCQ